MASRVMVPFLVAMMLLTGVCNTLLSKYQVLRDSSSPPANLTKSRTFNASPTATLQIQMRFDASRCLLYKRLYPCPQRYRTLLMYTRAQMFVGEMGCWLVVFGSYLYSRYISKDAPLLQGGYEQVDDHDSGIESDNEETEGSFSAIESANPVAKSLVAKTDGRKELKGWSVILLALPACCDIAGTTLMNVGLLFVAASIYQMTRGALVLFVGVFSITFLKRKLYFYQWLALFLVVLGVAIVGLAGAIAPNPQAQPAPKSISELSLLTLRTVTEEVRVKAKSTEALYTVLGVLMIAAAQIFTATQFVSEEWILEKYALEPLKVVGWEGVFGFIVTIVGMVILHFAVGTTEKGRNGYFDAKEGWREMSKSEIFHCSRFMPTS